MLVVGDPHGEDDDEPELEKDGSGEGTIGPRL